MSMPRVMILTSLIAVGLVASACDDNQPPNGPTPQTFTITATASLDGYVSNSGSVITASGAPLTGDRDAILAGLAFRQFYSFDLSQLPVNADIDTATLRLYQAAVDGTPYISLGNVIVDHVNYGNNLTGNDYNNLAITSNIGVLSTTGVIEYKSLAVTTAVRNDLSVGRTRSQFRLRMSIQDADTDGTSDSVSFSDAEQSCCLGQPPQLLIILR